MAPATASLARPVLTMGSAHDDVHVLGRLLADAGHENSVSEGTNPFGVVDESILRAVHNYRSANSVPEEDSIPSVPMHERRNWIGPELWAHICGNEPAERQDDEPAERQEDDEPAERQDDEN